MRFWALWLLVGAAVNALPMAESEPLSVEGLPLSGIEASALAWETKAPGVWKLSGTSGSGGLLTATIKGLEVDPVEAVRLSATVASLPDGPVRTLQFWDQEGRLVGQVVLGLRARGYRQGPFPLEPGDGETLRVLSDGGAIPLAPGQEAVVVVEGVRWRLKVSQVRRKTALDSPPFTADYWAWRLPSPGGS